MKITMTIEEKIKIAKEIITAIYKTVQKKEFLVEAELFSANGISFDEWRAVVAPTLDREKFCTFVSREMRERIDTFGAPKLPRLPDYTGFDEDVDERMKKAFDVKMKKWANAHSFLYLMRAGAGLTATLTILEIAQPIFEEKAGIIKMGSNHCSIPLGTLEYYLAKCLFSHPPETRVSEDSIASAYDLIEKCKSGAIYDAMRRLNKRIKRELDIDDLVQYQMSNFWIKKVN